MGPTLHFSSSCFVCLSVCVHLQMYFLNCFHISLQGGFAADVHSTFFCCCIAWRNRSVERGMYISHSPFRDTDTGPMQ